MDGLTSTSTNIPMLKGSNSDLLGLREPSVAGHLWCMLYYDTLGKNLMKGCWNCFFFLPSLPGVLVTKDGLASTSTNISMLEGGRTSIRFCLSWNCRQWLVASGSYSHVLHLTRGQCTTVISLPYRTPPKSPWAMVVTMDALACLNKHSNAEWWNDAATQILLELKLQLQR